MDWDSDSTEDVFLDPVDILPILDQKQLDCPNQDHSEPDAELDKTSHDKGGETGVELIDQDSRVESADYGYLCDQLMPVKTNLLHLGGAVSTKTAQTAEGASVYNLTQINVTNPTALSMGGELNVTSQGRDEEKTDSPRPESDAQKLRRETERNVERWTEGMIKTNATQAVLDKISRGRTWITITGSPGEGKTTAGYLVLKELYRHGRDVYNIRTPADYFKIKKRKQTVLMLDDIFGSWQFDTVKKTNWDDVLNDLLATEEHRGDRNDAKVTEGNEPTVLLTIRSNVLKELSSHLGRFKEQIHSKDCVVDLTVGMQTVVTERKEIWKYHAEKYNVQIDDKTVNDVCQMSVVPHGFPHCCRLFAAMYSEIPQLSMTAFFSSPLEFLNQTMESLMKDDKTGPLLKELLMCDGCIHLDEYEDDSKAWQYAKVVASLEDTYLTRHGDTVTFHHPSIYDSAAFVLCKLLPSFVMKHCSVSFLNERVRFSGLDKGTEKEHQQTVTVDNYYVKKFIDRLRIEFERRNLSLLLSHRSFHDEGFVSQFMQCIINSSDVRPLSDAFRHVITTRDRNRSQESFLFLMTKNNSDKLLRFVCSSVKLSPEDQKETLFGICSHASFSSMDFFLKTYKEFNCNVKNAYQQTPLLLASTKRSGKNLKMLVERTTDINETDMRGNTALHNICRHGLEGDTDIVKMLIENGANLNQKSYDSPYLPLHIASLEGHQNVITALLDCGADIDKKGPYWDTPLKEACLAGHGDVIKVLVNRGANVNAKNEFGHTPLDGACIAGNMKVIELLISCGAAVNTTDSNGNSPLHVACECGHLDIALFLLDKGLDVDGKGRYLDTPLKMACLKGRDAVVEALVKREADVNAKNEFGHTPLHSACMTTNTRVIELLIRSGADVNGTDNSGKTPLDIACSCGTVDVVSCLLDLGADIDKKGLYMDTPLKTACLNGQEAVVKVLVDRGANVNAQNEFGHTALDGACISANLNVIKLLLDAGADVNITDIAGNTPLRRACDAGKLDVIHLFHARGADDNI